MDLRLGAASIANSNVVNILLDNIVIEIYHSRALTKHSWLKTLTDIEPGRPDITILVRNKDGESKILFVGDAKYRERMERINREARIVLGYMKEYDASFAAIFFDAEYAGIEINTPIEIEGVNIGKDNGYFYKVVFKLGKSVDRELIKIHIRRIKELLKPCLLYTSPSPRDLSTSRMPSSA